ncbi:MAG: helix-turn-helix domain-containing protein, partial [Longimicrobiales bacterium]|nr:helix-turn-helix domain-containing protein [Longimicrobiales bacterium]
DVPMLVRHFTERAIEEQRLPPRRLTPEAVERLAGLDWPGNVRELKNTVERLLILSHGPEIGVREVERLLGGAQGAGLPAELMRTDTFAEFKDRAEKAYILGKLREHDWNVSATARAIDMPRSNLYKKIDKHGLQREE